MYSFENIIYSSSFKAQVHTTCSVINYRRCYLSASSLKLNSGIACLLYTHCIYLGGAVLFSIK